MKTLLRRFAVLSIMLLPGACAVAPDKPVTLVSQPMSVGQARQAVLHMKGMSGSTGTSIGASTWTISNVTLTRTSLTVGRSHSRRTWRLQDIAPALSPAHLDSTPSYLALDGNLYVYTGLGPSGNTRAQHLADALLTLKAAASPEAMAREQQQFDDVVRTYHAADPKPAVTEDMRRYEIQAEAAVQEKQFETAAELYEQALQIAPWWPQARFNRALILESLGEYDLAAEEMQRYLKLSPDAPNARAAQDKIYQWQLKVPAEPAPPPAAAASK